MTEDGAFDAQLDAVGAFDGAGVTETLDGQNWTLCRLLGETKIDLYLGLA